MKTIVINILLFVNVVDLITTDNLTQFNTSIFRSYPSCPVSVLVLDPANVNTVNNNSCTSH